MATFTIDMENNITAHTGLPANADNLQSFATEKELQHNNAGLSELRQSAKDLGTTKRDSTTRFKQSSERL